MSKTIRNEASIVGDEMVDRVRSAIEHRATWMGLMCLEAREAGADWEGIARRAVRATGGLHGERILESLAEDDGIPEFTEAFIPELTRKLFEMDVREVSKERLDIEFHYCPLVRAWQKIGLDGEMIATLCDIAMDGDRGIAETAGLDFRLGETIAKGHHVCEVRFSKPRSGEGD